jgi:phage tail-like protein
MPDVKVPGVGYSFGLDLDGSLFNNVISITGLKLEQETIPFSWNSPDGKYNYANLQGVRKTGEVTLTLPLMEGNKLTGWHKDTIQKDRSSVIKNCSIFIYDQTKKPIYTINLINALLKSWELDGELKAGGNSVLNEKITIVYDDAEVV